MIVIDIFDAQIRISKRQRRHVVFVESCQISIIIYHIGRQGSFYHLWPPVRSSCELVFWCHSMKTTCRLYRTPDLPFDNVEIVPDTGHVFYGMDKGSMHTVEHCSDLFYFSERNQAEEHIGILPERIM